MKGYICISYYEINKKEGYIYRLSFINSFSSTRRSITCFPEKYIEFMKKCNGGFGNIGEGNIDIWGLEEVIDFYNKGGGIGLGFKVPNQTLPEDELLLSDKEKKQLIAFMKTLTDKRN